MARRQAQTVDTSLEQRVDLPSSDSTHRKGGSVFRSLKPLRRPFALAMASLLSLPSMATAFRADLTHDTAYDQHGRLLLPITFTNDEPTTAIDYQTIEIQSIEPVLEDLTGKNITSVKDVYINDSGTVDEGWYPDLRKPSLGGPEAGWHSIIHRQGIPGVFYEIFSPGKYMMIQEILTGVPRDVVGKVNASDFVKHHPDARTMTPTYFATWGLDELYDTNQDSITFYQGTLENIIEKQATPSQSGQIITIAITDTGSYVEDPLDKHITAGSVYLPGSSGDNITLSNGMQIQSIQQVDKDSQYGADGVLLNFTGDASEFSIQYERMGNPHESSPSEESTELLVTVDGKQLDLEAMVQGFRSSPQPDVTDVGIDVFYMGNNQYRITIRNNSIDPNGDGSEIIKQSHIFLPSGEITGGDATIVQTYDTNEDGWQDEQRVRFNEDVLPGDAITRYLTIPKSVIVGEVLPREAYITMTDNNNVDVVVDGLPQVTSSVADIYRLTVTTEPRPGYTLINLENTGTDNSQPASPTITNPIALRVPLFTSYAITNGAVTEGQQYDINEDGLPDELDISVRPSDGKLDVGEAISIRHYGKNQSGDLKSYPYQTQAGDQSLEGLLQLPSYLSQQIAGLQVTAISQDPQGNIVYEIRNTGEGTLNLEALELPLTFYKARSARESAGGDLQAQALRGFLFDETPALLDANRDGLLEPVTILRIASANMKPGDVGYITVSLEDDPTVTGLHLAQKEIAGTFSNAQVVVTQAFLPQGYTNIPVIPELHQSAGSLTLVLEPMEGFPVERLGVDAHFIVYAWDAELWHPYHGPVPASHLYPLTGQPQAYPILLPAPMDSSGPQAPALVQVRMGVPASYPP